jgi:hypothetical protein
VKQYVFIFSDYHLVQGEETRVGRIKILDKKLELEPDYLRIFEKPLGHFQRIIIVRVIRRETIEIFIFLKNFYVPPVQPLRDTGTVGVVGIHNCTDA